MIIETDSHGSGRDAHSTEASFKVQKVNGIVMEL